MSIRGVEVASFLGLHIVVEALPVLSYSPNLVSQTSPCASLLPSILATPILSTSKSYPCGVPVAAPLDTEAFITPDIPLSSGSSSLPIYISSITTSPAKVEVAFHAVPPDRVVVELPSPTANNG